MRWRIYLDLRDDALGGVGNVLLLGLLATIGAMLGVTFEVDIPTVEALRSDQVSRPTAWCC